MAAVSYPTYINGFNPLAYFRLADIGPDNIADETSVYDGTRTGTITFEVIGGLVGDTNKAMQFYAASSSGFTFPATPRLSEVDYTVSFLIKTTGTSTPYALIAAGSTSFGFVINNNVYMARYDSALGNASKVYEGFALSLINDGNWHHVTYTWDISEKTARFYLDGVLLVTQINTTSFGLNGYGGSFVNGGASQGTDCELDEISIIQRKLNDSEIKDMSGVAFDNIDLFPGIAENVTHTDNDFVNTQIFTDTLSDTVSVVTDYMRYLETFEDTVSENITITSILSVPNEYLKVISEFVQANSFTAHKTSGTHTVQENVNVTEFLRYFSHYFLSELLTAQSSASEKITFKPNIVENILSADTIALLIRLLISESISSLDNIISVTTFNTRVKELLSINELNISVVRSLEFINDAISLYDSIIGKYSYKLFENISSTDVITNIVKCTQLLQESAFLSDSISKNVTLNLFVNDQINLSDLTTNSAIFNVLISENAVFSGLINIGEDSDQFYTFVINTKSLGLSEYINYNFTSLSDNLACNNTGIYELNDGTNEQDIVDSLIETGLMDFDSNSHKQIPYAYIGLSNNGEMIFKTITDYNGTRKERWYELKLTTDAVDTRRIKLGKGIKARYWQFSLHNKNGADFELEDIELLPLQLKRRI